MERIINTYDQLTAAVEAGDLEKSKAVAIMFRRADHGRGGNSAAWQVFSPYFHTDISDGNHWRNYHTKTFNIWRSKEEKEQKFKEALAWAKRRFGWKEWERNAQGDYVPKAVNEKFPLEKRARKKK